MSEQTSDGLDDLDLDAATVERLRDGTATRDDNIAKLESSRRAAAAQGDAARVERLDAQLSSLRIGE